MDTKDEEFLTRLLSMFRIEAREHLDIISAGLIEIEKDDPLKQSETIEKIYREAHSLKGAARSVDLPDIVAICQSMESVFSALKQKEIVPAPQMLDLLHQAVDRAIRLVGGEEITGPEKTGGRELIRSLESLAKKRRKGSETAKIKPQGAAVGTARSADVETTQKTLSPAGSVRISVAKLDALLLKAEEMLSIKLAAGQRAAEVRELNKTFDLWKKQKAKYRGQTPGIEEKKGWLYDLPGNTASLEDALTRLLKATESDQRSFAVMIDSLLDDVKQTLMLPVSSLLESLPGLVRNLSRDAAKEVELNVDGGEIEVDRRILEEIKDPLVHLVRNCIDHGIELPAEREIKKKPPHGNIKITVSSRGGKLDIAVSDDGAGIDALKVKAMAEKGGTISREEADRLSDHESLLLVFESGVTTSSIITDISGRGLGLAIVREKVEKLNGTVAIESGPDSGTTIRMIVPLTLVTFRGVIVGIDDRLFVFPSANVERALRIKKEDIRTVENRETIVLDGQALALVSLADVLGIHAKDGASADSSRIPVIVLTSAGKRMAFLTDEILHEQEVLVKPLGRQLSRVRHISGATVLGSGKIVPILNIQDVMKSAVSAAPSRIRLGEEEPAQKKSVLIAEDSITARTLLKTILESAGYDVKTAVDGIEAFASLKTYNFDMVVSDVDMPRMNGFELTEKIRADKRLTEMPVVLVTALESREDKERGIDVGANAYIVKSSFDQGNLIEIIGRLI